MSVRHHQYDATDDDKSNFLLHWVVILQNPLISHIAIYLYFAVTANTNVMIFLLE
jgi:hypothetical protein